MEDAVIQQTQHKSLLTKKGKKKENISYSLFSLLEGVFLFFSGVYI